MSICIAIIPPAPAIKAIREAIQPYIPHMENVTPESSWHIGLVFGSSVPSIEPLRQSFHQTLRVLSIGEGEERMQLWASVQHTPGLTALREETKIRINSVAYDILPFHPHIYLGSFTKIPSFGIIDTPLSISFSIRELSILQTDPYEILGTIPLTP